MSVAFSPDGTKIVSGSDDQTIKVWELKDQPVGERTFVASHEEPTVILEAYMKGCSPLSINGITVTSWEELMETFEELMETFNEAEGEVTIKVWDSGALRPQIAPSWPKLTPAGLSGRQAGDAEREDERTQPLDQFGRVLPGRDQDCVGIGR